MALLAAQNLSISFGRPGGDMLTVVDDLSLNIEKGSFTVLVGGSGTGKSTLLQMMAGLVAPTDGKVLLEGKPFHEPPKEVIYVFQQYSRSLMSWLTISQNVAFGIRHRVNIKGKQLDELVLQHLKMVGLEGFENYYPRQISGGMQQRVAIARALICKPDVLLMDEPFSAVDALTKSELQDQLLKLWRDLEVTIVFVTHDIEEAVYLGQRVLVLADRPARIVSDVEINLPEPRNQLTTKEEKEYLKYRHELLEKIFSYRKNQ